MAKTFVASSYYALPDPSSTHRCGAGGTSCIRVKTKTARQQPEVPRGLNLFMHSFLRSYCMFCLCSNHMVRYFVSELWSVKWN